MMYKQELGVIETLAPLHVGATAGEESGNLNLIFRDQFTQTGIVPGSSIRGRLRADMRSQRLRYLEQELNKKGVKMPDAESMPLDEKSKKPLTRSQWLELNAKAHGISISDGQNESLWYGQEAKPGEADSTTESWVKFEYASVLWLPVFCPGQPIVWVSCPRLLKRYQRLMGKSFNQGKPLKPDDYLYYRSESLKLPGKRETEKLFFNFGFLTIAGHADFSPWFPLGEERPALIVSDDEIGIIHDMALYRQSRVSLEKEQKRVAGGAFFNTEALPEGTLLVFPVATRKDRGSQAAWHPFGTGDRSGEVYLGGLESIGFGHCEMMLLELPKQEEEVA